MANGPMLRGGVPCPDTNEGRKYLRAKAAGTKALDAYAETIGIELDGRQTIENMEAELIEELTDEDIDLFDDLPETD